jgi:hypothetical protein
MALQFIHDNRGNATGVFIPIEEWQDLKTKYSDLQNEEAQNNIELISWQKDIVLERIEAIKKNPELLINEEQFWKEIENES